jgi:hypothetical protein
MNFSSLKIKVLLTVFFIVITTTGIAQAFEANVFIGSNNSKINGIYNEGYWVISPQFGAGVKTEINNNYCIRIEIKYLQKGNNSIPNNATDYNVKLDYLEFPLLIEKTLPKRIFNLNIRKEIKFIGGFAIGKLISTKEKDYNIIIEEEKRDPFNQYDFTGQIGIGIGINKHISFESRFSLSLIPIRIETGSSPYIKGKQYNNSIGVIVAYTF